VQQVKQVIDVEEVTMVTLASQPETTEFAMPPAHMSASAIAADLEARIAAGEYLPGTRLPTYGQLADLYSVSVATSRRAIGLLRRQGTVEGHPGKGVYVPLA
jgi:GntR family transcriptional regulator